MSILAKGLKQLQGTVLALRKCQLSLLLLFLGRRVLCLCRGSGIRLVYPSSGMLGGTFMDQLVVGQDEV